MVQDFFHPQYVSKMGNPIGGVPKCWGRLSPTFKSSHNFRLKPEQHSIGSFLNLSLLSPTKLSWDYDGTSANGKMNETLHDTWKWHDDE